MSCKRPFINSVELIHVLKPDAHRLNHKSKLVECYIVLPGCQKKKKNQSECLVTPLCILTFWNLLCGCKLCTRHFNTPYSTSVIFHLLGYAMFGLQVYLKPLFFGGISWVLIIGHVCFF